MPCVLPQNREVPLILLASLLWLPGVGGDAFLSDDIGHLSAWGLPPLSETWQWFYRQDFGYYRPLTALLWKLEYMLWGNDPVGYQVVNIVLHTGCALLVHQLGNIIFPAIRCVGLLAAVVFLFLPGLVFGVLMVSALTGLRCSFFYLAAALAYLYGRQRAGWSRASGPIFFLLALFTKELALSLPLLIGLWEAISQRAEGRWHLARWFKTCLPYGLVLVGYLFLRWTLFSQMPHSPLHANPAPLSVLINAATYAAKGIAPWGLENLKPFLRAHPFVLALGSGGLLALALGATWRWRRGLDRGHLLALGWFGITVLPIVSLYSPWNTYLPAVGTALLIGSIGVWRDGDTFRLRRSRQWSVVVFMALAVVYSLNHQRHWFQARALCQRLTAAVVELDPGGPIYLANLPAEWNDAPLFVGDWALAGTLHLQGYDHAVTALGNVIKRRREETVATEVIDGQTFVLRLTTPGEFFRLEIMDVLAGARRPERGLSYAKGPVTITVADLDAQGQANALRITSPEGLDRFYLWDGMRLGTLVAP